MVDKKPKFQQKKQPKRVPDTEKAREFAERDYVERPWESPYVRPKLTRMIPLYISEPYKLKIKFIAEQTNFSQQEILRQAVYPAVDRWIEKLTQEQDEESDK